MIVSTKGRYVLRVMIDLAEHADRGYIPMKEVAERQKISLKYLEKILPSLKKNDFITGIHGKGGGYKLTRKPEEYRIGDILRVAEGNLAPVACLKCDETECELVSVCRTRPMWEELDQIIKDYFDGITLADLMADEKDKMPE